MRLNLINKAVIAAAAIQKRPTTLLSPVFGETYRVNDKTFKFADSVNPSLNILIDRVDLGELFKGVVVDISKLEFNDPPANTKSKWCTDVSNPLMETPQCVDLVPELTSDNDPLGNLFRQWKRLVGLGGLQRIEVDLSVLDDFLTIDARDAIVYRGLVRVKYK